MSGDEFMHLFLVICAGVVAMCFIWAFTGVPW